MEQYARSVHFVKGVNNEIYNIYGGQFKNTVGQFIQEPRKNIENIFWRRNMKYWESSKTRFCKVSRRTEPCLR